GCLRENNTPYITDNGKVATVKSGEIISKQKFMYGYYEARIKLPKGISPSSCFWLFPMYREREVSVDQNNQVTGNIFLSKPYPEELDIIETRSVLKTDDSSTCSYDYNSHIYDFCLFWNNNIP